MPIETVPWPDWGISVTHVSGSVTESSIIKARQASRSAGRLLPGRDRLILTHAGASLHRLDFAAMERLHGEALAFERTLGPPKLNIAHCWSSPLHVGILESFVALWELAEEPGVKAQAFGRLGDALDWLGIPRDAVPPGPTAPEPG